MNLKRYAWFVAEGLFNLLSFPIEVCGRLLVAWVVVITLHQASPNLIPGWIYAVILAWGVMPAVRRVYYEIRNNYVWKSRERSHE